MNTTSKWVLTTLCLGMDTLALASPPPIGAAPPMGDVVSEGAGRASAPARISAAERRARRCQRVATEERYIVPQGTSLWGTKLKVDRDEQNSVLVSLDLGSLEVDGQQLEEGRVEGGRLVAGASIRGARAGETQRGPVALAGATLVGTASDGQSVEVAVCEAEPASEDPEMVWYRIESWDERSQSWVNPCVATREVPRPRALAVAGVWDAQGAHREVAGKFTFACEAGVIVKCMADWGYKPWQTRGGRALGAYHQACTRLARADYCGNGRSHTRDGVMVDVYDGAGVQERARAAVPGWDPAVASFEAAWTPEGAYCLAHTRNGEAVKAIMEECPGRFVVGAEALGEGDRCVVRRRGAKAGAVLVRNRSYGKEELAVGGGGR